MNNKKNNLFMINLSIVQLFNVQLIMRKPWDVGDLGRTEQLTYTFIPYAPRPYTFTNILRL